MLTPVKGGGHGKEKDGDKGAKDKDATKRLARCGRCTNCKSSDCGACYNCADKAKFGGPGIKKQACINRKCLLMVPRDEDAEKVARKRAKQRAIPPTVHRLSHVDPAAGDATAFLSALAIELPGSPSSRSSTASPLSPATDLMVGALAIEEPAAAVPSAPSEPPSPEELQALSEQSLFALALDDEGPGPIRSQPAMLYAAVRTPNASPLRRPATTSRGAGKAAHANRGAVLDPAASRLGGGAGEAAAAPSPSSPKKRSAEGDLEELELDDDDATGLKAAFTANISAKMELDAPPPAQPRLDELHDEFVLLNWEHRRHDDACMPILAF